MFERKMLHCRGCVIKNLSHGSYLPVEVPAANIYSKGTPFGLAVIEIHTNRLPKELEFGMVEPEVPCYVHKSQETWNKKCGLVEKHNDEGLEARGADPMDKCFHENVIALEHKRAKIRKCNGFRY
jgi:hypothetical protein